MSRQHRWASLWALSITGLSRIAGARLRSATAAAGFFYYPWLLGRHHHNHHTAAADAAAPAAAAASASAAAAGFREVSSGILLQDVFGGEGFGVI